LAVQHDGEDRWYLEALGIGADKNWDTYLDQFLADMPLRQGMSRKAYNDIIWRSRSSDTPRQLAEIIRSDQTPTSELPRFFRAYDFQKPGELKDKALASLIFAKPSADSKRRAIVASESLIRLKAFDIKTPEHAAALKTLLDSTRGTSAYVDVVIRFNV